jgi:hypothetical protein
VAHEEQLAWEARAGRPAAAAAFLSALVGMGALAAAASLPQKVNDSVEELLRDKAHSSALIAAAVLQAVSIALLAPALSFLYKATRHRRPEVPRAAFWLGVIAPPLAAILTVANAIQRVNAADKVVPQLPLPPKAALHLADHELTRGTAATVGYLGIAAGLALAFAVGLNAIHARRAGLLSQFMGILGVIVGVLLVVPILGPPVVQYFWTVALGLLFVNRWPGGGRGPAWDSGEAIPWPTAAETRAAQTGQDPRARPQREPRTTPKWLERLSGAGASAPSNGDGAVEIDDTPEPTPLEARPQHPRSKKRKKKKRR